jgi:hypothetical protein
MELTQEQLDERIAVLKRLRSLLEQQRAKFAEYLNVLEKQQDKIELDDGDALIAHAELEQQIVASISNLQKVIEPVKAMYNSNNGQGLAEQDKAGVKDIQNELDALQKKVLLQNEHNRALLRVHLDKIRRQLTEVQRANPYNGRRSIYAERYPVATTIAIEA